MRPDRYLLHLAPRPSWVLLADGMAADIDFDFQNGRYWQAGHHVAVSALLTCTRASVGLVDNAAGIWSQVDADTLRVSDKGVLVEETRTNVALCRDLTNAAWTASNMTAAKDQVGIDGVANAASAITATANNATILQAITATSAARWTTAFVKRLAGSGAVSMTIDGGSTYTAVTVTSAWTRVSIPTQTLANPSGGFKLAASGDSIAVDFVQVETSTLFATSPILTTSAAATRAVDVLTTPPATRPAFGASYGAFIKATPIAPTSFATAQVMALLNASGTNRVTLSRLASTGVVRMTTISGGVSVSASSVAAWAQNTSAKVAIAVAQADQAISLNGATPVTSAGNLPVGVSGIFLGSTNPASPANAYLERFALWPSSRPSNAALQSLTT